MDTPTELKYTKDHEWVRVEDDIATVGITFFAQSELGDIVYVDIDSEGEEVPRNETFGAVEAVKTVSDLFMPLSGKITAVNGALQDKPELVNADPYGEGWMIKIHMSDRTELDKLLSAEEYDKLVS